MKKQILIPIILVTFLDQLIKIILENILEYGKTIKILGNFFKITLLNNTGAAFSLMIDQRFFLILISIIVLYIIYKYLKNKHLTKQETIIYGILIGGILGNLIDRIFKGYVVDYIDILNFPVFNLADACIVISVILIILFDLRGNKSDKTR